MKKAKEKKRDTLGTGLIFIGCIFLCEPFFGVYDLLPDIFGAFFIALGLQKLSFFEKKLWESASRFKTYIWICIARIGVEILAMQKDSVFDSTMLLTFAFVFGVLDGIVLIPAFLSFYEGMEYVYVRGDGKENSGETESQRGNLHTLAVIFIIVRAAAPVLPMLSALSQSPSSFETLHRLLTLFCALIALIIGIAWLSGMKNYLSVYKNDDAFAKRINERYETEILPDSYLWNKIYAGRFCAKTCGVLFLMLGIPFSAKYILPEFLFGPVMLWALYDFRAYINKKRVASLCSAYTVAGVAFYILSLIYAKRIGALYEPFSRDGFARLFIPCAALCVAKSILFILVCHEKYKAFRDFTADSVGLRGMAKTDTRKDYDSAVKKDLQKSGARLFALEVIFAVISAAAYVVSPWVSISWVAQFAFCIILMIPNYITAHKLVCETEMAI